MTGLKGLHGPQVLWMNERMSFSNYLARKLGTEAVDPMLDYIYDPYSTSAGQFCSSADVSCVGWTSRDLDHTARLYHVKLSSDQYETSSTPRQLVSSWRSAGGQQNNTQMASVSITSSTVSAVSGELWAQYDVHIVIYSWAASLITRQPALIADLASLHSAPRALLQLPLDIHRTNSDQTETSTLSEWSHARWATWVLKVNAILYFLSKSGGNHPYTAVSRQLNWKFSTGESAVTILGMWRFWRNADQVIVDVVA